MKIIYKRSPNNKFLYFTRKLQRHYNFYCYTNSKQSKDPKGKKIIAKKIGGFIVKGKQARHPLRQCLY